MEFPMTNEEASPVHFSLLGIQKKCELALQQLNCNGAENQEAVLHERVRFLS